MGPSYLLYPLAQCSPLYCGIHSVGREMKYVFFPSHFYSRIEKRIMVVVVVGVMI